MDDASERVASGDAEDAEDADGAAAEVEFQVEDEDEQANEQEDGHEDEAADAARERDCGTAGLGLRGCD
ncbi:hypothetical protein AWZ03_002035 [Drosophila navojoa]|uniref:Uncharacterized protein n=1 Tax=Drosophila navojoa TaxID=7232 RepID=A0A484BUL6_DRONA|nr:hypothetical protein AWZ03_002035 [Drosophila navojoa]